MNNRIIPFLKTHQNSEANLFIPQQKTIKVDKEQRHRKNRPSLNSTDGMAIVRDTLILAGIEVLLARNLFSLMLP